MPDIKVFSVTLRFYADKQKERELFKKLTDSADENGRNLNDEVKQILKGYFAKGKK